MQKDGLSYIYIYIYLIHRMLSMEGYSMNLRGFFEIDLLGIRACAATRCVAARVGVGQPKAVAPGLLEPCSTAELRLDG